jgi:hypothetical protein
MRMEERRFEKLNAISKIISSQTLERLKVKSHKLSEKHLYQPSFIQYYSMDEDKEHKKKVTNCYTKFCRLLIVPENNFSQKECETIACNLVFLQMLQEFASRHEKILPLFAEKQNLFLKSPTVDLDIIKLDRVTKENIEAKFAELLTDEGVDDEELNQQKQQKEVKLVLKQKKKKRQFPSKKKSKISLDQNQGKNTEPEETEISSKGNNVETSSSRETIVDGDQDDNSCLLLKPKKSTGKPSPFVDTEKKDSSEKMLKLNPRPRKVNSLMVIRKTNGFKGGVKLWLELDEADITSKITEVDSFIQEMCE